MLKFVDVAIHMQMSFKDINFLNIYGSWDINEFKALKPMVPFSSRVIKYLDSLSKEIVTRNKKQNGGTCWKFEFK